jgi:uncharacterized SAM-binding protein YcdF (DUF218 family)
MFDSTLCNERQLTQDSLFMSPVSFQTVSIILGVGLILTIVGFVWVMQHRKWKRRLTRPKVILWLAGLVGTLLLLFITVGKGLFLPTDFSTTTDAIVVLGRWPSMREERINLAAELWQAKQAPVIFASGRGDAGEMIQLLVEKGIPHQVLNGENCSMSTQENALFTAAILNPQVHHKILLITDTPHMWRSLLEFRNTGFTVIPHPSKFPSNWSLTKEFIMTVRESTFLVGYTFRELFTQQRLFRFNDPELVKILQQAKQYSRTQRQD